MKLGSDGLGKTILDADIVKVKKVDDLIVLFAKTTKPVMWQTRMGFQEEDLRTLVFAFFKPRNLLFVSKAFALSLIKPLRLFRQKTSGKEVIHKKGAP
jgi:hypothetical protein